MMKTKEEVQAILNNPEVSTELAKLEAVLASDFSHEELACMFVGVVKMIVPHMNNEQFLQYCRDMRSTFNDTRKELDQLDNVVLITRMEYFEIEREKAAIKLNIKRPTPVLDKLAAKGINAMTDNLMINYLKDNDLVEVQAV